MVDLPLWFRLTVLGLLTGLLIVHLLYDMTHLDYEGATTTLMLGGIVGASIGLDRLQITRKESSSEGDPKQ